MHLGVIGHGLDVTAISAPLFSTGNKKPRLATGLKDLRRCTQRRKITESIISMNLNKLNLRPAAYPRQAHKGHRNCEQRQASHDYIGR